jgi:hypothetical protein
VAAIDQEAARGAEPERPYQSGERNNILDNQSAQPQFKFWRGRNPRIHDVLMTCQDETDFGAGIDVVEFDRKNALSEMLGFRELPLYPT